VNGVAAGVGWAGSNCSYDGPEKVISYSGSVYQLSYHKGDGGLSESDRRNLLRNLTCPAVI
jgi:hypothetical protein